MIQESPSEENKQGDFAAKGREGEGGTYISTSFTSLPEGLIEQYIRAAKEKKIFPRDLFLEAVLFLVSEREKGTKINYVVPLKGGVKKAIWLTEEACKLIDDVAKKDRVKKNVLLITSLQLYAKKEGLNVGL